MGITIVDIISFYWNIRNVFNAEIQYIFTIEIRKRHLWFIYKMLYRRLGGQEEGKI